jgi:phosphoribosylformimino-5-aminoimidazole carboxamide ribotide isomerase
MIIFPAVDIKGGKCVRLTQGRADQCTVYFENPVDAALQWQQQGAEWVHVVDLDGAFGGKPVNRSIIREIASALSIPIEVGGGLRTDADIKSILDAGAKRVIIGTRAITDSVDLAGMARRFGEQLAVGIDARDGKVQVSGWVETTQVSMPDLAVRCSEQGIKTLICTDITRDGMLKGHNVTGLLDICGKVKCRVIASGGITTAADITALKAGGFDNLEGAIVGKVLYEGAVTLKELIAAAKSG